MLILMLKTWITPVNVSGIITNVPNICRRTDGSSGFLTFPIRWKRQKLSRRIKGELKAVVHGEFSRHQTETTKSRSILSLSLQNMNTLTEQAIDEACDQLSTFLFAGHDTTSILLSWVFYELSRTPHALWAVRDELNDLFGLGTYDSILHTSLHAPFHSLAHEASN
jgi:cytochrome P450